MYTYPHLAISTYLQASCACWFRWQPGRYISSEGKESIVIRITAVIAVLTGTGAVIISNANLAYAGVGGAMIVAWIWASYRGRIREFADVCLVMACGVLAISIMLGRTDNGYSELDGLSCFVSDSRMVWIVSVVVLVVWAAIRLASKWTVKFRGKAALAVSVGVSLAASSLLLYMRRTTTWVYFI